MFNRQKYLTLALLIFSSLYPLPTSWSLPSNPTSFDEYKQECLKEVKKKGLTVSDGEKLCNCTVTKFQKSYDTNQFKILLEKAKTDKKALATFKSVGEDCYNDILFES